MTRNYKIVFKLPCEKTFSFNISVCEDDYDPKTEVGKYPSRHLLDYYLLYIPQLQEFSGSEISNGTVVSVYLKNEGGVKSPVIKNQSETETKHETESPSFKSLYWKNGNIVKTRGNGYGIISNNVVFCEAGSIHSSDIDETLTSNAPILDKPSANDIMEVWCNSATRAFNPYCEEDIHKCCYLVWCRPIEMTREEIEKKLNLPKGSLVVTD